MDPKKTGSVADAPSVAASPPADSPGPSVLQIHDDVVSRHAEGQQAPGVGATGDPQSANASSVACAPQIDPELVRKGVRSVLGAVDGVLCRKIFRAALSLTADEGLSKGFASDAGLTKDEAELMADMSAVLCEKYQVAGQYAPEALLLLATVGYATRVVITFRKLDDLARIKQKSDRRPAPAAAVTLEPDGA